MSCLHSAPRRPPSREPGPAAGRRPGRVKIIAAAGLAVMAAVVAHPAAAQRKIATADVNLYVAPDGSDVDNDCLARSAPCRTPWHACVNAMRGWDYGGAFEPFVHLAAGLYRGGCNLAGQLVGAHTINIVGEQSEDQSCNLGQAARVVIEADAGQPAFYFQDLAIGVVRCLNVRGGAGFNCRQTPASDIAFVIFGGGEQSLATAVQASDSCGINLGGVIWLAGDMTTLFAASNVSRITIGGGVPIVAINPVAVEYFAIASQGAGIEFRAGVTIDGPIRTTGSLVTRAGWIATNHLALPGGIAQATPSEPGFIY